MKKLVFVLAIAMLACGVYGRDFVSPAGVTTQTAPWYNDKASEIKGESWDWPLDGLPILVPYQWVDICSTKVKMDVGYWIQVDNCSNLGDLKLKQTDIHTYAGSVTPKFTSNADFDVKADFALKSGIDFGGDWKWATTWSPASPDGADKGFVPAQSSGLPLTVTLTLTKVKLNNLTGGANCVEVGTLTIKVKPHVTLQCQFNYGTTCGQ